MKRATWLDGLRGLAILLVVVWHSLTFNAPEIKDGWFWDLFVELRAVRMPVLFLLSGLFLQRSLAKPLPTFAFGKFANLAWPFGVWLIIFLTIKFGFFEHLDKKHWGDGSYLWFIFYLMIYFCVAQLFKQVPPAFMVLVFAVLGMAVGSENYAVEVAVYGVFFFGGAALSRVILNLKDGVQVARLLLIGTLFLLYLGIKIMIPDDVDTYVAADPIPFLLTGIPLVVIAVLVGAMFLGSPTLKWLQFVGRNSMVYYASHVPVQLYLIPLLYKAGWNVALIAVIAVVSSLIVCTCLALGRKTPLIDALFVFPIKVVPPKIRAFVSELFTQPAVRVPAQVGVPASVQRSGTNRYSGIS